MRHVDSTEHFHHDSEVGHGCGHHRIVVGMLHVSAGCIDDEIVPEEPQEASSALGVSDWEEKLPKTGEKIQSWEYSPSMIRDVNGQYAGDEVVQVEPCLCREGLEGAAKEDRQRD